MLQGGADSYATVTKDEADAETCIIVEIQIAIVSSVMSHEPVFVIAIVGAHIIIPQEEAVVCFC